MRTTRCCWTLGAWDGWVLLALLLPPVQGAYQTEGAIKPPPPGKLVDIGGYRLHIHCMGQGSPAVVLEAGGGDFSFDWALVQPEVARFTRVSSYDRAGSAWSDPGPVPRTMHQEVFELHELMRKARVKGPYVLVGHSYGGLLVRLYARQYPRETVGLVLVDSTDPDTTLGLNGKLVHIRAQARGRPIPPVQSLKTSPPHPPSADDIQQNQRFLQFLGPPKISSPYDRLPPDAQKLELWARFHPRLTAGNAGNNDFWPEELQQMYLEATEHPYPLGDLPLIVLAGGKAEGPPPGSSAEVWKRLVEEKRQEKANQAHLSRNSQFILDPRSGHHIQLDDPDLVINAIRQVVEAARHHTPLIPAP